MSLVSDQDCVVKRDEGPGQHLFLAIAIEAHLSNLIFNLLRTNQTIDNCLRWF